MLKNPSLTTTVIGVPNLIKTKKIQIKILWLVSLILSSGFCFYLIIQSILDYSKFEVVTKIEILDQIPSSFPTISICNENSLLTNRSIELAQGILSKTELPTEIQDLPLFKRLLMLKYYLVINLNGKKFSNDFKKFFISCLFNSEPCKPEDFEWYFDPFYANCFRFNSGKVKKIRESTRPGYVNGLQIELFVGEPWSNYSLSTSSGAIVFVHNSSIEPSFTEGLSLSVEMLSNLAVSREYVFKKEKPHSECLSGLDKMDAFDSDFFRAIIKTGRTYRRVDCFDLCFQSFLIKECRPRFYSIKVR